ncbi:unnamed protein product [Phytophthora lilii]|uniref:Unnamed protein product n=1 Tax=Phytophthora lilii TaxID=2077276 RepID=A0A9W6THX8_9STRA|nr:unnamed protein product [Phytophthora lilii]
MRPKNVTRASRASVAGHISGAHLGETVDVLDLLRLATLETVEAIVVWRNYKQRSKTNDKSGIRSPTKLEPEQFKWNGINYLLKLASDLEFLGKHTGLMDWLGFTLQRNPFILPLNLDCRAKLLAEQYSNLQPLKRTDTAESNRFLQVGGKRFQSIRESLQNSSGDNGKPATDGEALAHALAERKRAKTPYETRVINDEELVPHTPSKAGALRPKSRVLQRTGKTKYSSVLPSQIGEVDMARHHEAEIVVLKEEAAFGRYARDIHGRIVPEDEAVRRFSMVGLSDNAYNIPSTLESSYRAEDPDGNILRLGNPSQSDVPGKLYAKKRSGMLGPISKPEWRSFERPPPPRRRARGAQLEETLAAERKANAQLGVLLDLIREEMERKAMDVAYFESCSELQVYSEELKAFTIQAQRELNTLRQEYEEKKYMYQSKIINIQKKEDLLNTFKAQHKAVIDTTVIVSLNQEQQRREDQEQAAVRTVAAAEQHEHDQATPLVQHFCATQIQKFVRGMLARESYERMKIEFVVASTFIQAGVRGFLVRRRVAKMYWHNTASVHLQRAARGWLARQLAQAKRRRRLQENSAVKIQKVVRGQHGRVRMLKIRKLVGWRLQLALAAQSVNAVALQELAASCQNMIALPNLMKTGANVTSDEKPLPALVLGIIRLLMIFTSDADDEWDIPNTRWREAARFLRCGVSVTRRMQKIADAAAGASRASMSLSGGFAAAGVAASTPYLRESRLGAALLDAYTGDLDFRAETFERIPRGWQAAVAIFRWTTAFCAITRLQHLLDPSASLLDPFLVVRRTLSNREIQHELTERRDADHNDEELARRFVPAELVQARGYPLHRPRPLLLVVSTDVPRKARATILDKLQMALPGLFLTITRSPASTKRSLGAEDSTHTFDFKAICDVLALGHSVILEGDVGLRDVTQRAFLSCFATIKNGLHPPPTCILLRGTITNRSDLFGPKEGSDKAEEMYREEARRIMVDADVKLALDRTTRLRLELAEDAIARDMVEQAKSGFGDLGPAPSPALVVVMEAVIVLLTPGKAYDGPSQSDFATSSVSWRLSRRLLAQPGFLRTKLNQVDVTKIPSANLVALERYLRHELWPNAVVVRSQVASSRLLFALAAWVESVVRTARLIAGDGAGFLPPEITRFGPIPGLFERVVVFNNSPTDYVQEGAGEDSAMLQLMDAVLADVRVFRTAHLLVSSHVNASTQHRKIKPSDEEERCVVTLFHECRRIFANVYSPSTGQRWLTVISEDEINKLLTPTAMPQGGESRADKLPPQSHTDMYARLARLCLLQRRRIEDVPESIEPRSPYELVVCPHAVRLYRHILQLGGYFTTITIAELARGHVQIDAFVHGSNLNKTSAQTGPLTLVVELESILGRLSAAQARRIFVSSPCIPSLMLDRLHLYGVTQTRMVLPEFQQTATHALKLGVRTTERAPGRVLLRRAVKAPENHSNGAASGERRIFTLIELHEQGYFKATFYTPGSSMHHSIRLSRGAAETLLHLSRNITPSQLQRVLLKSFCFSASEPKQGPGNDTDDEQEPEEEEKEVIRCYRLRRRVVARFPCVLRFTEEPQQRVTKNHIKRAYVQVELCEQESTQEEANANLNSRTERSPDSLRYRVWLPESCVQHTLDLHENEIEASLPAELSWKLASSSERRMASQEIVRRFFQWDPNGGKENGCVVAHLPCGSFWATEVLPVIPFATKANTTTDEDLREQQPIAQRDDKDTEVSVVSCIHLLDDLDTESDDEEDDEFNGDRVEESKHTRKIYSYDTEEDVHRGSYRANGLYVVVRVTMCAKLLRDLQPTLASPTDRVRERDSFTIKFFVYHPASSGSAIAEIHGRRYLREVVGPDKAFLIASSSLDHLMRHIILSRLDAQIGQVASDGKKSLKVAFMRDRLYAKQKATPVTKTFERDSAINAAKLIDESRRQGIAGERGVKVLTTAKVLPRCGRTLITVFDVSTSRRLNHEVKASEVGVVLRVDAYVCETSQRLSLLLESSDLVHIVGCDGKDLLLPTVNNDEHLREIKALEKRRSQKLALMVLDYLRVEHRSDGRGDRLVLSDYFCSPINETNTSRRLFKTIRAVGHDQVLLSGYLDAYSEGNDVTKKSKAGSLRLELYDPASSSRCHINLSDAVLCLMLGLPESVEMDKILNSSLNASVRLDRANLMTHLCSFLHIEKLSAISNGAVDRPSTFAMELMFNELRAKDCMAQHFRRGNTEPYRDGIQCFSSTRITTGRRGEFFSLHVQLVRELDTNGLAPQSIRSWLYCSAFAPSELLVSSRKFESEEIPAEIVVLLPTPSATDEERMSAFFSKVCESLRIEIGDPGVDQVHTDPEGKARVTKTVVLDFS